MRALTSSRAPGSVLRDHLRRAAAGDVEGDIATNYDDDVVLLTGIGVLRGPDGVRESRAVLASDLPNGRYEYLTTLVLDGYAFLEWRGSSAEVHVEDGADSFVIRDGRIVMQSIHYTVRHRTGYRRRIEHARSDGSDPSLALSRAAPLDEGAAAQPDEAPGR